MTAYEEVMRKLVEIGLLDVILPFILSFTIVFGTLQRTRLVGEEHGKPKTNINAMIAFVLGFLAVAAANVLNLITMLSNYFALAVTIGFCFALVVGLAGGSSTSIFVAGSTIAIFSALVLSGFSQAGIIPFWVLPIAAIIGAILAAYYLLREKTETIIDNADKKDKTDKKDITEEELNKAIQENPAKIAEAQKNAEKAQREAFYKTLKGK